MNYTRWKILPVVPMELRVRWPDFSQVLIQLLYNRRIDDCQSFLNAEQSLSGDPFLLSNMERATHRIKRAISKKEKIAVYGDFDADGVTATVLLVEGISLLGGCVVPYIPHRVEEGYGLNTAALDRLLSEGISLVITQVPRAIAVINPKLLESKYSFLELAGVGVAYKLYQALLISTGNDSSKGDEFLDLVALGTIADMVPLLGENRYLVKKGLEVLNRTSRLGLKELIYSAGLNSSKLDSECVSYVLAPRINSAARLEHALSSYNLLVTKSQEEATRLAQGLEATNRERQRLTAEVVSKARIKLQSSGSDQPIIIISDPTFPSGINGIVAGKLCEEFYRPVVVVEAGKEECRGSARSIREFNVIQALNECADILLKYGGHPRAAGFSIEAGKLTALNQRLLSVATRELSGVNLQPTINIDLEIPLSTINTEVFKNINAMAPFGQDNPSPLFLSREVKLLEQRTMGGADEHVKLKLKDGNVIWDAIGFNLGRICDRLSPSLDIVYSIRPANRSQNGYLELNLVDFTSAGSL
ncbi:MAG: DHHA1 domain-containing protein [Chloroflexi bacterium]|nr:DHHA1 domain-containing protein [Chloroflexota bacterium]